ncbi:MAG TPA: HD domain-containing protein [Thermomicrobiales bacterium]|nr:HD domain-containing protein [Thermomicrobiales bacterium]
MPTYLTQRFADAVVWASELHRDQLRKGTEIPYVAHLLGVASLVVEFGGTEDEAIAALLHDAVEDQGGASTRAEIAKRFGEPVALIVDGCTDDAPAKGGNKAPWKKRKVAYLKHLRHERNRSVVLVSLADKTYNAESILHDLNATGDAVWNRFNASKDEVIWYYSSLVEAFGEAEDRILSNTDELDLADPLSLLLDRFQAMVEEIILLESFVELENELLSGDYEDDAADSVMLKFPG